MSADLPCMTRSILQRPYIPFIRCDSSIFAIQGLSSHLCANLTDVDDKIINRANETGTTAAAVAEEFSAAFIEQMHRFGILDPDIRPRATREIEAMQDMISLLIEKGFAYVASNGDVYFSVRSDTHYGVLSGR